MDMTYFASIQTTKQNAENRLISILIVDDQKVIQARIQEILSTTEDLKVVGIANDGDRAIAKIKSLQPDVVLMDVEMPKMNGIKTTEIITQKFPESKILMLSSCKKEDYVRQSINAGASGYILKNSSTTDLITAIRVISQGYSHFDLDILKSVRQTIAESEQTSPSIKFQPKFSSPQLPLKDECQLHLPLALENQDNQSNQQLQLEDECQLDLPLSLAIKNQDNQSKTAESDNNTTAMPALSVVKAEEFLPPIGKWLNWGALVVVTAIALGLPTTSILKYKTTVKTQATVRPAGELRLVQAATEGQIAEIFVEQGQTVNRGDVIATIDSSRWQTQKKQLQKAIAQERLQLLQLDSQMKVLESQIIAETESNNSEILAAKAELSGNRRSYRDRDVEANAQVRQAQAQLGAAKATFKAAQSKATRYRSVASQGALSQEQLAEAELEVQQQQQQIATAEAELQNSLASLNPSSAEMEMTQQRIQQIGKSGQANIARLHREKEALIRQRIEINQQLEQNTEELNQIETDLKKTNLTATAFGTISVLNLRNPGQAIQPGQEIAQIIPRDAPLEIKATVLPQDIAKLETNQKVQMRVSACPYPDYGTLNGTVSKIARDISQPQNNNRANNYPGDQSTPAFFEVTISPQESSFGRGVNLCHLQLGMEGNTDIITKEESVLKFMLRKARLISNI